MQVAQERGEIQLLIQRLQLVNIGRANLQILGHELYGHIGANGRERLREQQFLAPRGNLLALLALDTLYVGKDILALAPLADQFAGALLADARHAGNIIRRIAPDGQNIAHQHGVGNAILRANILRADNLHTIALLLVEVAVGADQLTVILVGRHHIYVVALLGATHCERADNVVGLISRNLIHGNTHSLQQTAQVGHRGDNILGCRGAVGLVFGV